MKTTRSPLALAILSLALGLTFASQSRAAGDDDIANESRYTIFPYVTITDQLTGFGYLGYVLNDDKEYQTGYLGLGASYSFNKSVQLWGGLIGTYTYDENKADKLELRPFIGPKFFLPNDWKWNIYNFTRYEYRDIQDRDTDDWTGIHRLRSRFGVEIPLASGERAWQPKTWYALLDVEPFYRFDKGVIDPFRARAGIAYIVSDRMRMELIYHAQWTRPSGGSGLEFTDNIFRLNIKIALNGKGVLRRTFDGGDADD
jgi:hypothetical protein